MAQTVIGIFNSASEAQNAVDQLLSKGFTKDSVNISTGSSAGSSSMGGTTGSSMGNISGSSMGSTSGSATDNFMGTTTGSSLSGSTGYSSGTNEGNETGIGRFFRNLFGGDNDESDRYSRVAERSTVVTVYAKSTTEAETAARLLDQYGAVDVDDQDKQYNKSAGTYDSTNATNATDATDATGKTISIIEENIQVGKREVETGGVRLRSRIVETPFTENLSLREEHVKVERTKVDRAATNADLTNFQEGTIELTERSEVPVVNKEARIVEEVSLGKDVEHREETIKDTVRKTEVDVEQIESDLKNKNKNIL